MATFSLIQTYTLTSTAGAVEFDPIPQTFDHLWLAVFAKSDRPTEVADDVRVVLDNNAAGSANIRGYGAHTGVGQDGGSGSGNNYFGIMNTTTNQANRFGGGNLIFLNYATSQSIKSAFTSSGSTPSSANTWQIGFGHYQKSSSSPITKIGISGHNQASGLVAGTRISLYGIKNT